jgi:hypothetical protein
MRTALVADGTVLAAEPSVPDFSLAIHHPMPQRTSRMKEMILAVGEA